MTKIIPIVLCGGSGSRLWPLSRKNFAKPFVQLPDQQSLLEKTYSRILDIEHIATVITIVNQNSIQHVKNIWDNLKSQKNHVYLLEEQGRNTAPAILMGALYAKQNYGDDSLLFISTADHLIGKLDAFYQSIQEASYFSQQGYLCTFGIQPDKPETGYGYIKIGEKLNESANQIIEFVEKPHFEQAQNYINSKQYLWNSGMFFFQTKAILSAFEEYKSEMFENALKLSKIWKKTERTILMNHHIFQNFEDVSIDYAIMENAKKRAVLNTQFSWSDIGSWDVLAKLFHADNNENQVEVQSELYTQNSKNNIIYSQEKNKLVVLFNVKNLAVMNTDDVCVITDKNNLQSMKQLYQEVEQLYPQYLFAKEKQFQLQKISTINSIHLFLLSIENLGENQFTTRKHLQKWTILNDNIEIIQNQESYQLIKDQVHDILPQSQVKIKNKNQSKMHILIKIEDEELNIQTIDIFTSEV